MRKRRLRIEAYTGPGKRRGVLIDCENWKGTLHERLEATIRKRLDAIRTDRRTGVRSGCELFVFAPETQGSDDLTVDHPGMLSVLIRSGQTITGLPTVAASDHRASSLPMKYMADTASTTLGSPGQRLSSPAKTMVIA